MFFNETTKEMKKAKSHKTIGKANMNKEEKCTNKKNINVKIHSMRMQVCSGNFMSALHMVMKCVSNINAHSFRQNDEILGKFAHHNHNWLRCRTIPSLYSIRVFDFCLFIFRWHAYTFYQTHGVILILIVFFISLKIFILFFVCELFLFWLNDISTRMNYVCKNVDIGNFNNLLKCATIEWRMRMNLCLWNAYRFFYWTEKCRLFILNTWDFFLWFFPSIFVNIIFI